ncbi:MAG: GTP-binding protein [Anaerolineae bacterium]|nr:GTP-binding protein [Anaerolineae bacterium]
MANLYKIIVTGPFNSGKTSFVSTISEIPVVSTERKITTEDRGVKAETTVAMDYGRVTIDGRVLHLNGTPGQSRFDFMWEILANEMNGFIVLVDSTDPPSLPDANDLIKLFSRFKQVPYLVVANKADLKGNISLGEIRREINLDEAVTIMPCDSTSKSSVRQVLLQMIELIEQNR